MIEVGLAIHNAAAHHTCHFQRTALFQSGSTRDTTRWYHAYVHMPHIFFSPVLVDFGAHNVGLVFELLNFLVDFIDVVE